MTVAALLLASLVVGCASPPSVVPLLEASRRLVQAEAGRIQTDAQRDAQRAQQDRQTLDEAFDADLDSAASLSAQWVRDATRAYVLAREELLRHEQAMRAERQARAARLEEAAAAQQRAIDLLQLQDALMTRLIGLDAWRLPVIASPSATTGDSP